MRIVEVAAFRRDYRLQTPSVVAYEAIETAPNIIVRIDTDDGLTGWGNAGPDEHVTGETAESVHQTITRKFADELMGVDASQIEMIWARLYEIVPDQPTAIAAIDIALYDLLGKTAKMPIYHLIGRAREKIVTSVTLSIEETNVIVERARQFRSQGFRFLKIKCGLDAEGDIERVRAVRAAVGSAVQISLDANQGYDVAQTLRVIDVLRECNIAFIEQPVSAEDLDALREVCLHSPIPVMADESVLNGRDLLVTPAPLANLKLMKTGGITGALKANAIAEARGIRTMIGCMDESRISMTAAAHVALGLANVAYADLDGHLDILDDVASGGLIIQNGEAHVTDSAGLGIEVSLS